MAHFSGPLRLNGAFLGVVLVTSHLKNLIAAVQDYSGLGRTGETVLGKRDDKGKIIFLAPLRFNQDAVLKNISLDTHFAVPMNETLSGKEKVMPDSVDYRGEAVLAITKYIDSVQWGLVVKIDRSEAFSTIVRLRNELYGLVAFSLVCAILIAFYLAKNIVEPISRVTDKAHYITNEVLSENVIKIEKNEVKSLERSFEQMTEGLLNANKQLKETQSQLIQSAKLASLGELATGVAHELNQPLQIIQMSSELGRIHYENGNSENLKSHFEQIDSQVNRAANIIQHLKLFARDSNLQNREKINPNEIVHSALFMFKNQIKNDGIILGLDLSLDLPLIFVNRVEIEQVLVNLISNAKDALKESQDKRIILRTSEKYGQVTIEVEDTGSGILNTLQEKIFDPFFTTKPVGEGTGLGLSICYGIIKDHGGKIELKSEYRKGAIFKVHIPIHTKKRIV